MLKTNPERKYDLVILIRQTFSHISENAESRTIGNLFYVTEYCVNIFYFPAVANYPNKT